MSVCFVVPFVPCSLLYILTVLRVSCFFTLATFTVTQIPLEAPRQQDGPGSSSRPPWVRPVRKKTSSTARSPAGSGDSPLNHGSPEEFQPSTDAFLDHHHLGGTPQPSPQQAFQQQQAFGLGSAQAFMDTSGVGMMQTDPGAGTMSAADIMAFLNADPALDMNALLASPDLGALDQQTNGFFHLGTPTAGSGAGALSP